MYVNSRNSEGRVVKRFALVLVCSFLLGISLEIKGVAFTLGLTLSVGSLLGYTCQKRKSHNAPSLAVPPKFEATPTAISTTMPEPEFELTSPVIAGGIPAQSSRLPRSLVFPAPGPPATGIDAPVLVTTPGKVAAMFKLPQAPAEVAEASWVPSSQLISLGGSFIRGGMLYLGARLATPVGTPDPCLINPELLIASNGNFIERQTAYWPSYAEITPIARKAYIDWLADGRKHPDIDTGIIYLYFYGLERRVIFDGTRDETVLEDFPFIAVELKRLLTLYGKRSAALREYMRALLQLVELAICPSDLYRHPVPELEKGWELPMYVRLAIGQAARDRVPLPGALAYAWTTLDPATMLRTAATRCQDEFKQLFLFKYEQLYGQGMVLAIPNNKLKLHYSPASAGFRTNKETSFSFEDAPNILVSAIPASQLRALTEEATTELDGYSRLVQKSPQLAGNIESIAYLPVHAWPRNLSNRLSELHEEWASPKIMVFDELWRELGVGREATKDRAFQLLRALDTQGLSMLPNLLGGARLPKGDETVLVFSDSIGASVTKESSQFIAALQAVTVASALCTNPTVPEVSRLEMATHLRGRISPWNALNEAETHRLNAHYELLLRAPASPTQLKNIFTQSAEPGATVGLMLEVATSLGPPGPEILQVLERIYKSLGLNPKKVWSDLHASHAGTGTSAQAIASKGASFSLDLDRINALQLETEKVSILLGGIFTEEEPTLSTGVPVVDSPHLGAIPEDSTLSEGLFAGLDSAHLKLVDILMSQPSWSRDDLLEATRSLGLMLDGALERINEVSFDTYDFSFTEGDDPIEVSSDILELLKK